MNHTLHLLNTSETEFSWTSHHADILSTYDSSLTANIPHLDAAAEGYAALSAPDASTEQNKRVHCHIIRPALVPGSENIDKACILIHGLNERSWDKYKSWAQSIADKARCAVIMFPIAFHMDRSPSAWADFAVMRGVSKDRLLRYPALRQSSMANAALSERLDEDPSRLFYSGLMSALDLGDIIATLRQGEVPGIAADATLGFFGYSIGVYLLQCLSLADTPFMKGSKRFLFCGGPYLSAMTPVSKFIMDSRAHERIIDFWVTDFSAHIRADNTLASLIDTPEGKAYCSMIDPLYPQTNHCAAFSDGSTQVAALTGDEVMPKAAIIDFFKGTTVTPTFYDLPPSCTHISPFNPLGGNAASAAFENLFDEVAAHLFR